MRLEELGGLVKRGFLFALLGRLLVHDLLESLPLARLVLTLVPRLANMLQLILLFLAVDKSLFFVLVFLAHIVVVLVECLRV